MIEFNDSEKSNCEFSISTDLNSSELFEGPEKLLKIWIWKSKNDIPKENGTLGLRSIPLIKWVEILNLVNCKILSKQKTMILDAYILSESSLFVYDYKIVLKTCGTTTLLTCVDKLFEIINELLIKFPNKMESFDAHKIIYSRRSFLFPNKQNLLHQNWDNEVCFLNNHFLNGKSHIFGSVNDDEKWYYYSASNCSQNSNYFFEEQTFEIMMTQLDIKKASCFFNNNSSKDEKNLDQSLDSGHVSGLQVLKKTKLDNIFGELSDLFISFYKNELQSSSLNLKKLENIIDDEKNNQKIIHDAFLFNPCGFSSNSISQNHGFYYNLHITPESKCSYASFETNFSFQKKNIVKILDILTKVLTSFFPKTLILVLISEINDSENINDKFLSSLTFDSVLENLSYKKKEKKIINLNECNKLTFLNYVKI